ncbi:hypothetical protein LguiA_031012 [Lonicera macranthoides]
MAYEKNQNQMKLIYHYSITYFEYLILTPLILALSIHLSTCTLGDAFNLYNNLKHNPIPLLLFTSLTIILSVIYYMSHPRDVYLVNYTAYKPSPSLMTTKEQFMLFVTKYGSFSEDNLEFQKKILERSGLGDKTYFPEAVRRRPPDHSFGEASKEADLVMFGAVDELLAKTGVKTKDIGILVVNCSSFTRVPSLSAAIVNRYKLRSDIVSYTLSGMGCSAGVISVDLAKRLLQVSPNTYALLVSIEVLGLNWYQGKNKHMVLPNCIFRMGGAAVLLSNRSSDRGRSKYQLLRTVRTHKGADDKSYRCVSNEEDEEKSLGLSLTKDIMAVAGETLKTNITTLGPLVLPISEQLLFLTTSVARNIFKLKIKPHVPDFKLAFEHFCIHSGGKAVLDEVEKNLELTKWHMEPSRMTLYRFGNISSSSIWYELAYSEAKGRIKKGDRVWQIAFGSGFKCNSAVWRALHNINPVNDKNPWMDEINDFPVEVPRVDTFHVDLSILEEHVHH